MLITFSNTLVTATQIYIEGQTYSVTTDFGNACISAGIAVSAGSSGPASFATLGN